MEYFFAMADYTLQINHNMLTDYNLQISSAKNVWALIDCAKIMIYTTYSPCDREMHLKSTKTIYWHKPD